MDCAITFRLCVGKEAQMKQDTVELVRRLCCEVGMIMEDMNPVALISPHDPTELRTVVEQLTRTIVKMCPIMAFASAIPG